MRCYLILLCVFLCSCINRQSTDFIIVSLENPFSKEPDSTISTPQAEEQKIINAILALPEIKEKASYITTTTHENRHLRLWITQSPTPETPFYIVHTGEETATNLITHAIFHVYPDVMHILYYDATTDTCLSLKEWRQQKNATEPEN